MPHNEIINFLEIIKENLNSNKLVRVVLSNKRNKSAEVKNVHIKAAVIKKSLMLSFVSRYPTKDITKNFTIEEGYELIVKMLEKDFSQADIFTTDEDIFLIDRNNKYKMTRKMHDDIEKPSLVHDEQKKYLISAENNVYLRELGITTAEGKVKNDMNDKFKQINKYVEIVESIIRTAELPESFSVYDMGAGKGYLTFALYDHLVNHIKLNAKITGIELRKELAESSNLIAFKAGFKNLSFESGTIDKLKLTNADILIALHACDTATDDAIAKGIEAGAKVIICAPCCHKQVRKNMEPSGVITNITRHGILFERQAEILTDTIRAMIMEAYGYRTKVFEFISQEHTSKNLLIAGVKERKADKETVKAEIQKLKEIFGVKEHYLEKLLEF
jgi:hypothetical protein